MLDEYAQNYKHYFLTEIGLVKMYEYYIIDYQTYDNLIRIFLNKLMWN